MRTAARHMGQATQGWHQMGAQPGSRLHAVARQSENCLSKLYETVKAQGQKSWSPQQVQSIISVIESISLEDLGVDAALGQPMTYGMAGAARELRARLRTKGSRGTVTYLDIHDDPTMTIGIFQLPPGARMPLHDHPGMTVFSRLLYGTLHVRAYDWVHPPDDCDTSSSSASPASSDDSSSSGGSSSTCEPPFEGRGSIQPARLVTDRVLTAPSNTMVLFPHSGGNIHAFTAISPCAILDVLTPPYGNRNCTYYREVFPPQWLDGAGQPGLVPSEDVASWVAWQQAGHQAEQQQQQQAQQGQQQQQQQSPGVCCGASAQPGLQFPDAAVGGGGRGQPDIVVGLEVWQEPPDFRVARGAYKGVRLTPR